MLRERECDEHLYYVCDYLTAIPTTSPSRELTANPSLNPSSNPTFDPILFPVTEPTSWPTMHLVIMESTPLYIEAAEGSDALNTEVVIIGAVILALWVVLCVYCLVFGPVLNKCLKGQRTKPLRPPIIIRNALAVIICIADYDDHPQVTNLDGIRKDYQNLHKFFKKLDYTVIPKNRDQPCYWTEEQLVRLLFEEIPAALLNDQAKIQYDALIVCVSSHGLKNAVITSDLRKIEKSLLHRAVSQFDDKVREIPRIFIIDACDGLYRTDCAWPLFPFF